MIIIDESKKHEKVSKSVSVLQIAIVTSARMCHVSQVLIINIYKEENVYRKSLQEKSFHFLQFLQFLPS